MSQRDKYKKNPKYEIKYSSLMREGEVANEEQHLAIVLIYFEANLKYLVGWLVKSKVKDINIKKKS